MNFVLCLHAEIISFLEIYKFLFRYFDIYIFSSNHKLHNKFFEDNNLFILSSKNIFNNHKGFYNEVLCNNGYKNELKYLEYLI